MTSRCGDCDRPNTLKVNAFGAKVSDETENPTGTYYVCPRCFSRVTKRPGRDPVLGSLVGFRYDGTHPYVITLMRPIYKPQRKISFYFAKEGGKRKITARK